MQQSWDPMLGTMKQLKEKGDSERERGKKGKNNIYQAKAFPLKMSL